MTVQQNLREVHERIARACEAAGRSPEEVTVVAVSKRQPDDRLLAAYEAGQRDFGENYVQEFERKQRLLPDDARWHLIGHLQTNKAKKAVDAALVHTLDSLRLGRALSKAAIGASRNLTALVEVNLAREPTKAGADASAVSEIIRIGGALEGVEIRGLMCIPPQGMSDEHFQRLRALRDELEATLGCALPDLSMGMSQDFESAIAEGATLVRLGTAIFGPREP